MFKGGKIDATWYHSKDINIQCSSWDIVLRLFN
jgi:hypothetical protein